MTDKDERVLTTFKTPRGGDILILKDFHTAKFPDVNLLRWRNINKMHILPQLAKFPHYYVKSEKKTYVCKPIT